MVCVKVHDQYLIDFHVHVLFAPLCRGKLYFFLSSIRFLLRLQSNLVGVFEILPGFARLLREFWLMLEKDAARAALSVMLYRQQLF